MRDFIKDFLKRHRTILDKSKEELTPKDIEDLYLDIISEAETEIDASLVGEFTQVLSKYINPLRYLDGIPQSYLAGTDIESFVVPYHSLFIDPGAFANCPKLTKVEISETVKWIKDYAFCDCLNLRLVIIHNPTISFEKNVFSGCIVHMVVFNGTAKDWEQVWPYEPFCEEVRCTDQWIKNYIK